MSRLSLVFLHSGIVITRILIFPYAVDKLRRIEDKCIV